MIKSPEPPELQLNIPKDAHRIRALGYAIGLIAGIHGGSRLHAKRQITTNDKEAFDKIFWVGYEPGLQLGMQAAHELLAVLKAVPRNCRWPICMVFADQRMIDEDFVPESVLTELDRPIQEGLEAFRRIYQKHLL